MQLNGFRVRRLRRDRVKRRCVFDSRNDVQAFGLPVLQIVWEMLQLEAPSRKRNSSQVHGLDNQKTELGMNYLDSEEGIEVSFRLSIAFTCSSDGLTVSNRTASWAGCRGSIPVTGSGCYYYECRMEGNPKGICRVGWSTLDSSLNLGTSRGGYGFGATGKKATSNQFTDYGVSFGVGDVIGCTLDLDAGKVSFSKNGTDLGVAFSGIDASVRSVGVVHLGILLPRRLSQKRLSFRPFRGALRPPSRGLSPLPAGGVGSPRGSSQFASADSGADARAGRTNLRVFGQLSALYESSVAERGSAAESVGRRGCWWEASAWTGRSRSDCWRRVTSWWRRRVGLCVACNVDIFYEAMVRNHLRLENLLFFVLDEADKYAKGGSEKQADRR